MEPLEVEDFIKVNNLVPISSPIFFASDGSPDPNGLLSNQIFGITQNDRSNIFSYIHLGDHTFINPVFYKALTTLDSKIVGIVHGTDTYSLDDNGCIQKDPNGETGMDWLKKILPKINFKKSSSEKRKEYLKFIDKYKDRIFIKNMVVIPAYYRDVNSTGKGFSAKGVGDVNKIYNKLVIAAKSLQDSADYGLTLSDSVRARIQDIIQELFQWFCDEPQLSQKQGVIHRAGVSKSTDMSARVVISAPKLNVETMNDFITDIDHAAVPLSVICANFYPYIMFWLRRFFENEYSNNSFIQTYSISKKKISTEEIEDFQVTFSDTKLKEEIDRFIHGYANRFIPVTIRLKNRKQEMPLAFKGYNIPEEEWAANKGKDLTGYSINDRPLTWCDLFFMAAVESVQEDKKCVLITRYPIDSCYNQFPTLVNVSSTKKTEPMVVGNKFYAHYPHIRKEDIGINTSNLFIDTLNMSNVYLDSIGGDYDGDQISVKGIYSEEANAELRDQINSKRHFIGLGGTNLMNTTKEGIDAMYQLTLILDQDKQRLTNPEF